MTEPQRSIILNRSISRRSMLKTATAAGIGAAALAQTRAAGAQESGGTLNVSFYQGIPNPWQMGGNGLWTSLVFERLISWNETYSEIVPALAESWSVSDDGTVYTFHLRPGITWHDGTPFTADDIVWSYQTLLHPTITGTWLLTNLEPIKGAVAYKAGETEELPGIVAIDELTVEITLEIPSGLFLQQAAMIFILPKHRLEAIPVETLFDDPFFREELTGLGPFKFTEWEVDQFIVVSRYDGYYRGQPLLENIVARSYAQPSVALLAQQNGEIDVAFMISPDDTAATMRNENLDVFPGPPTILQSLSTGFVPEAMKDTRVRQAILHAIDRETIISSLYTGTAAAVNVPFVVDWVPMDGIDPYAYDPERAKALLDEAGWNYDDTLGLWTYYLDQFTGRLMAAIQQYLGDIGVKVEVLQTEGPNIEADSIAGNFGLIYQGSATGPDPDAMYTYFHSSSTYNYLYSDPRVDELLDAGRIALDQDERAGIYAELAVVLNELNWWIPLWTPLRHWAVTKNVSGMQGMLGTPGVHIPFYSASETWSKS